MEFHPNFIIRSPLLPFSHQEIDEPFLESIYLSSPHLYRELSKGERKKLLKEEKKVQTSLYKYHKRATTRCTPFGLFAGISIGEWGYDSRIIQDSETKRSLLRSTRLDMNVLCALSQSLEQKEFIKPYLKYYKNNSLYQVGQSYRYVEYYYEKTKRFHRLSKVDYNEYLQAILQFVTDGKTFHELEGFLIKQEIDIESATAFINEIIAMQLLTSELQPTVTGEDYLEAILSILTRIEKNNADLKLNKICLQLRNIQCELKVLDNNKVNQIEKYSNLFLLIKELIPEIEEKNLFQVDLYKQYLEYTLSDDIKPSLIDAVSLFTKISPTFINPKLEEFKKRFLERFQQTEVSLMVAMDTEIGFGYPANNYSGINGLIDDLIFPQKKDEKNIMWSIIQEWLHKIYLNAVREDKKVVHITDKDLSNFQDTTDLLPHTFCIYFKLLNSKTNKILLSGIGGSSAINLLGRFTQGNKSLHNICSNLADFEQEQFPNSVLAEIVHLPESRAGNILSRESFRKYEIPYLAKSSDGACQISVDDLYISVKNNKIILRSKRLNKEVIPRMGNAHNYSVNSLPVYHFLCDLQNQYFPKPFVGFDWGALSNQYRFLPRVEYKNIVLSPAKWQLTKFDLKQFQQKIPVNVLDYFNQFRAVYKIPEIFYVVEGDNELLIDAMQENGILSFIDEVKGKDNIKIEEFIYELDNSLIMDKNDNAYSNELIAIVKNQGKQLTSTILPKVTKEERSAFLLGSECVYFKIYSGHKTADEVLTKIISPLSKLFLEKQMVSKWFFIRYSDPEHHLRWRMFLNNPDALNFIIQSVHDKVVDYFSDGLIFKVQTDIYERELHRYGNDTIGHAESLFFNDSIFTCNCLTLPRNAQIDKIRWQIALRSADQLLDDFNMNVEQKYSLFERLSNSFINEHPEDKNFMLQLSNKYRALRAEIQTALTKNVTTNDPLFPAIQLLNRRSKENINIVRELVALDKQNQLSPNLENLLSSYLHMNLNRLFVSKNRANELVVYTILAKYYKSQLAIQKNAVSSVQTIN